MQALRGSASASAATEIITIATVMIIADPALSSTHMIAGCIAVFGGFHGGGFHGGDFGGAGLAAGAIGLGLGLAAAAPYAYGYGSPYGYDSYAYYGGGCYLAPKRVWTPWGGGVRLFAIEAAAIPVVVASSRTNLTH